MTTYQYFNAEGGGFEPPIAFTHYDGLANRCLQPLGHPSNFRHHRRKYSPACQNTRKKTPFVLCSFPLIRRFFVL